MDQANHLAMNSRNRKKMASKGAPNRRHNHF